MSDKVYIGNAAIDLNSSPALEPISMVRLVVSEDAEYVSGDNSGRTIEVSCPWGTQAMADDLLSSLGGYSYQPLDVQTAFEANPLWELGDGVTVGGLYSQIVGMPSSFGLKFTADIEAPESEEINHEYPYQDKGTRAIDRKIAQTRASLRIDVDAIEARVDGLDGDFAALDLRVDGISSEVGGKIDGNDAQTLIEQNLADISLTVSGTNGTTKFTLKQGGTTLDTETFDLHVKSVNIEGTLTADKIRGSVFELLDDDDDVAATFYLTGASSVDDEKLDIVSGAIELETRSGDIFLGAYNYQGSTLYSALQIKGNRGQVACTGDFVPNSDELYDLGGSGLWWNNIYCASSQIDLSDRVEKQDICYDIDLDNFFNALKPASYKMLCGTSGRTHYGMIAQDVEDAIISCGMTTQDFAGFVKTQDDTENQRCGLRYSEFIALCIDQIQKLKARVNELERASRKSI